MPRKSVITVTDRAEGVKNSAADLARRNPALARRLAGNPHGSGSRKIPLKDEARWHTYISNTEMNENENLLMKERGWVPVVPDDLACPVDETGFRVSPDGYLIRGAQGKEMLWKMSTEDYRILQDVKTRYNQRGIGSASTIKRDLTEAASSQMGDEAASYINGLEGSVIDRITGGDAA